MRLDRIMVAAALVAIAGIVGHGVTALPPEAEAGVVTPIVKPEVKPKPEVVDDTAIPYCANEDGSGSSIPCRWDASVLGNGKGDSFTITAPGVYLYDDGHIERD